MSRMVTSSEFSTHAALFIDIESLPGGDVFGLGATQGDAFRREAAGSQAVGELIRELREVAASAEFIAGHNIISHDLPTLDAAFAIPELRRLPSLEKLFLPPLPLPPNPYHRWPQN